MILHCFAELRSNAKGMRWKGPLLVEFADAHEICCCSTCKCRTITVFSSAAPKCCCIIRRRLKPCRWMLLWSSPPRAQRRNFLCLPSLGQNYSPFSQDPQKDLGSLQLTDSLGSSSAEERAKSHSALGGTAHRCEVAVGRCKERSHLKMLHALSMLRMNFPLW